MDAAATPQPSSSHTASSAMGLTERDRQRRGRWGRECTLRRALGPGEELERFSGGSSCSSTAAAAVFLLPMASWTGPDRPYGPTNLLYFCWVASCQRTPIRRSRSAERLSAEDLVPKKTWTHVQNVPPRYLLDQLFCQPYHHCTQHEHHSSHRIFIRPSNSPSTQKVPSV